MKQQSLTRKLAGILAVGFALTATGYLAFTEHRSANSEPTEPPASQTVEVEQPQVVVEDLKAEPLLDEHGFPLHPEASGAFLFSSKSLVIPPQTFETEETAAPDIFLPSSKVRFIDTRTLIESTRDDAPQPIEN